MSTPDERKQDDAIKTATSHSRKKRIHVVDRDRRAGNALAKALAPLGYDVRVTPSAAAFVSAPLPSVECCVLIDVSFSDQSGFELQQHLVDRGADAGIVFMTAHADISMAVTAMKRGAVDFLAKPLRMSELLPAVDAALLRSAQRCAARRRYAEFSERVSRLTPREREVLALVLEGKRNKQIADTLASQESTVKVHRSRLMRKLEVRSLAELLRVDAELGWTPSADIRRHEERGAGPDAASERGTGARRTPRFITAATAHDGVPVPFPAPGPMPRTRNSRQ